MNDKRADRGGDAEEDSGVDDDWGHGVVLVVSLLVVSRSCRPLVVVTTATTTD